MAPKIIQQFLCSHGLALSPVHKAVVSLCKNTVLLANWDLVLSKACSSPARHCQWPWSGAWSPGWRARFLLKALEGVLRVDGYQEIISPPFRHDFLTVLSVHGPAGYVVRFIISDFPQAGPPLKQLWLFLAGKRSLVVPSWGACSSPAPSRVRLVMHPLCKSSWKVFAMHEKELGCFWSTRARYCRVLQHHLLTSSSFSTQHTPGFAPLP